MDICTIAMPAFHATLPVKIDHMWKKTIFILLIANVTSAFGQDEVKSITGVISYKSSQNVYVKFQSTEGIEVGDTLYVWQSNARLPALEVKFISSISCVGVPMAGVTLKIDQQVSTQIKLPPAPAQEPADSTLTQSDVEINADIVDEFSPVMEEEFTASTRGRISAASYSYFSSNNSTVQQRMRYNFSLRANHINNSRLSLESYVIYRHRIQNTEEASTSPKLFRVYNLAATYDLGPSTNVILGRKISRYLSNVGAMDGLQVQHQLGQFTVGLLAGTRPDLQDFSLNRKRVQAGAFAAYTSKDSAKPWDLSVAFLEQRFSGRKDRRFMYFQHSSTLLGNLYLFASLELDLLDVIDGDTRSTLRPTSAYISLRYRVSSRFSVSTSYDARRNVIYLESYKNLIDQLIDQSTRQGFRVRFNYRPLKRVILGASGGYRFQQNNPASSRNIYVYLTFSQIPWINASVTVSTTQLETSYLKGGIYGVRMSKDLVKSKLFSEINYRRVRYQYGLSDFLLNQQISGLNLSWRILKKLTLSVNYEGVFQTSSIQNRIYANLIQRF